MEDEEGLILCHCSISDHNDDGEEKWEKSVKKYSDLISAAETEPNRICNFGVCNVCSRESMLGNQRKKTKEEALSLAYNERGHLKYLLVNFDGAIEDYTKAIVLYPNAITLYNRGQVYYRLGHFKEAIEDFEKALKHQKDFESAKMGLEASRQALKALV